MPNGEFENQLTGAGLGLVTGGIQNLMQNETSKGMAISSYNNQRALAELDFNNRRRLFEATGIGAQARQMREAGLSVSNLMKGGGQSGQTSGGVPSTAQAQAASHDNVGAGMQMALQSALLESQKKNIDADTVLKQEQAEKTGGADTNKINQEIEKIKADTSLSKQEKENKIQEVMTSQSQENLNIAKANESVSQTGLINEETKLKAEQTIHEQIQNKWADKRIQQEMEYVSHKILTEAKTRQEKDFNMLKYREELKNELIKLGLDRERVEYETDRLFQLIKGVIPAIVGGSIIAGSKGTGTTTTTTYDSKGNYSGKSRTVKR